MVGQTSAKMHKKRNPMMNLNEFGIIEVRKIFRNLNKSAMKGVVAAEVPLEGFQHISKFGSEEVSKLDHQDRGVQVHIQKKFQTRFSLGKGPHGEV